MVLSPALGPAWPKEWPPGKFNGSGNEHCEPDLKSHVVLRLFHETSNPSQLRGEAFHALERGRGEGKIQINKSGGDLKAVWSENTRMQLEHRIPKSFLQIGSVQMLQISFRIRTMRMVC
ncbi:MAG: hypothetical protein JPMHGGIA_02277 [Saprospiraceae bacterium]|jgi:hypothetical protein|nr:hypothetical protein [Saprospiraceae bacterium]